MSDRKIFKRGLFALFGGLLAISPIVSTAQDNSSDDAREFAERLELAVQFLDQINSEFQAREVVRDSSRLVAPKAEIAESILNLYVLRPDLRLDAREMAMRLATFQTLPDNSKVQDIEIVYPPKTETQKLVLETVIENRKTYWEIFDELDQRFSEGTSATSLEPQLIITENDRGWRPNSPEDFVLISDDKQLVVSVKDGDAE